MNMTDRKPRTPRKFIDAPCVLVLKEKHGNRHFHIPDDATLFTVALGVVKQRASPDYGYYFAPDKPAPCDLTPDTVETLPASLRAEATRKLKDHERDVAYYERASEQWEWIQKAITESNGRVAWDVIQARSDYEYEEYRLERYENL
jgi:hypothetical protein